MVTTTPHNRDRRHILLPKTPFYLLPIIHTCTPLPSHVTACPARTACRGCLLRSHTLLHAYAPLTCDSLPSTYCLPWLSAQITPTLIHAYAPLTYDSFPSTYCLLWLSAQSTLTLIHAYAPLTCGSLPSTYCLPWLSARLTSKASSQWARTWPTIMGASSWPLPEARNTLCVDKQGQHATEPYSVYVCMVKNIVRRVGQSHTFIGIYGVCVCAILLARKSPYIRSYGVYIRFWPTLIVRCVSARVHPSAERMRY